MIPETSNLSHSRTYSADSNLTPRRPSSPYIISAMALMASTPPELTPDLAPVPVIAPINTSLQVSHNIEEELLEENELQEDSFNSNEINEPLVNSNKYVDQESTPIESNEQEFSFDLNKDTTLIENDRIPVTTTFKDMKTVVNESISDSKVIESVPEEPKQETENERLQREIAEAKEQQASLQLKLEHQKLLLQQEQLRLQQMELENQLKMQQMQQQALINQQKQISVTGYETPISATHTPNLSYSQPSPIQQANCNNDIDNRYNTNSYDNYNQSQTPECESPVRNSKAPLKGGYDYVGNDENDDYYEEHAFSGRRSSLEPVEEKDTLPKILPYPQCELIKQSTEQRRYSTQIYSSPMSPSSTPAFKNLDFHNKNVSDGFYVGTRNGSVASIYSSPPTSTMDLNNTSRNSSSEMKFPPSVIKRIVSNFDLSTVADILPYQTISSDWFKGCTEYIYEDLRIVKPYRLLELFKQIKQESTVDYTLYVKHISLPYITKEDWPVYRELLECCQSSLLSITFGSKEESLKNVGEDWFNHGILFEKLEKIMVYRGCRNIPERLIVALLRRCKDSTIKSICLDSAYSSLGGAFWFLLQQKAGKALKELILTSPQFLQVGVDQSWDAKLFEEALPTLVRTSSHITSLDLSNIPSTNVDLSLLLKLPLMELGLPNGLYDGHLLQIQKFIESPDCKIFRLWVAFDNVPQQHYTDLLKNKTYAIAPPNRFSTAVVLDFLKAIGAMVRRRKEFLFMQYMNRIESRFDDTQRILSIEKNQPLFWVWIPCVVVDIRNAKWTRTSISVLPNLGTRYDRINSSFIWNNVWVGLPGAKSLPA